MIVKVCGLKDPANHAAVAALPGVDLTGMIFYPASPRFVQLPPDAFETGKETTTHRVGVFVQEEVERVLELQERYRLEFLQLHGNESVDYVKELRKRMPAGTKIIKAFAVKSEESLALTHPFHGICDYFLFDTPGPGHGGTGRQFDWSVLEQYVGETPFLLSGGIAPEHLSVLYTFDHPRWAGIDLNSRFETEPGIKDIEKLSQFIAQFREP
ncbi:MAG: phosphoribosylanthranilate isomerase [Marinilabiliales bacterium]|nr:phosphoribosylanthranilate isomerase [Marinilabiliales bacterium]